MESSLAGQPTKTECAPDRGLAGIFEAQVGRTPNAIAVKFGDRTATYSELNDAANRLAHHLIRRGVHSEEAVGISLDRSPDMIVAVIAVLKAGAAYLPLDPTYPRERLQFMFADAQPRLVLTQKSHAAQLASNGVETVFLDEKFAHENEGVSENPTNFIPRNTLAYLIYTSGSTGQPKAVAMEHGPLCNLLGWQARTLPGAAITLQFASLNFDVSFQEIFSTLASGGSLVLIEEEIRRDPRVLLKKIEDEKIERLFVPFVALHQLATAAAAKNFASLALRDVIAAGEQLRVTPQIREFFSKLKNCALHNHYGPTETHVVTAHTLRENPARWPATVPIGLPIDGAEIYILDENFRPVPRGETGEIYIGGACLARGYLNRADLSASRFVRDPFSSSEARLYRSGDRARVGEDGAIEFLGRNDTQVKIRGVRIEPGEIESALSLHPGLLQAVVTTIDGSGGAARLVAHYVCKDQQEIKPQDLRTFAITKLPLAALPSSFIPVDEIPLTLSGKVDMRALPPPSLADSAFPPRTDLQRQLAAIWSEALNANAIGIRDSFFELGGDSLMAMQVALAIEKNCGMRVPVGKLYDFPTIEKLARYLRQGPKSAEELDVISLNVGGNRTPLFSILGSLKLGSFLGNDQPFHQLLASAIAPGSFMKAQLDRISCFSHAIAELAEECLSDMRKIQPSGPYCLSGYSLGAIVAYEVANRLHLEGEKVAFLALIDPDSPKPSHFETAMRETHDFGLATAARRQVARLRDFLKLTLSPTARKAAANATEAAFQKMSPEEKVMLFGGSYSAPPCRCPLVLILANDHYESEKPFTDPRCDWLKSARAGFEVHEIQGNHFTIYDEPNVSQLAKILGTWVAKTQTVLRMPQPEIPPAIDSLVA